MDHIRCSIYKNAFDNEGKEVHLMLILEAIENGRWKDKINKIRASKNKQEIDELKRNLPCVTFSGLFSKRNEKSLIEYTNLYVIDFDKINKDKLMSIKDTLCDDPYIAAMFLSPSKGLKALVEVDTPVEDHKLYAYTSLELYFKRKYDLVIDPTGKDYTRLCFVSYDPNVHYNPEHQIYHVDKTEVRNFRSVKEYEYDENWQPSNDLRHIFEMCDRMVRGSRVGSYHKGNRNHFIYCLACNLNRAGVLQEDAEGLVWRRYDTLNFKEVCKTVQSAYKHRKHEHGLKPVMMKKSPQLSAFNKNNK